MRASTRRALILLVIVGFGVFLVAQLFHPSLGQPQGRQVELTAPREVREVLERRCYTCHSDQPRLVWYDKIAPASWLVAKDVRDARAKLNFSEIGAQPALLQRARLFEAVNMIQYGAMPLPRYLKVHGDAAVTPTELAILKNYLAPFAPVTHPTPLPAAALPAPRANTPPMGPSPNGVPYPAGWEDWRLITTNDADELHTLRFITGNDIAIKAIADHKTNPWPDGAIFAKVTLATINDGQGHLTPAAMNQVEFMEKDAVKYKTTEGWGFARFQTTKLKPYGKNAQFDRECTGCHAPMKSNDHMYTVAIARDPHGPEPLWQNVNQRAALKAELPYPVLDWKVITTIADRGKVTMSTLFGNDAAVTAARNQQPYPPGAVIALATWREWDNPRWFGSRVPGEWLETEFLEFTSAGPQYHCSHCEHDASAAERADRINALMAVKAVPLP
jgi:hypothetical protein